MTPTVGRIVHFVLHDGPHQGFHRPGIVVGHNGMTVNLQVFSDGNSKLGDMLPNCQWRHSVPYDPEGKQSGSWHWPEGTARLVAREEAFLEPAATPHSGE